MDGSENIRSSLADMAATAEKTKRAGAAIAEGASARHEAVCARLDVLRHQAVTDSGAAEEYQTLIEERGRLNIVLGQSRKES